jgi:hypothetical protein
MGKKERMGKKEEERVRNKFGSPCFYSLKLSCLYLSLSLFVFLPGFVERERDEKWQMKQILH